MHFKYKKLLASPLLFIVGAFYKVFSLPVKQGKLTVKMPKNTPILELGMWALSNKYERHERYLIGKYIKESDSVLELGACIGVVSLTIGSYLSDKTKQVSVEANPEVFGLLEENKSTNNGHFYVEKCIVSKEKNVQFYTGGEEFLASSTMGAGESIIVEGKTFDSLVETYFPFNVIIMDIEGGELEFFKSFELPDIRLIIWEYHEDIIGESGVNECRDILVKNGFKLKESSRNVEAWVR